MQQTEVLAEVKKAIDLWMDKTYDENDFYSHVLTIIKENSGNAEVHKEQLERFMFKVEELREGQRLYHGGDRSLLGTCKTREMGIDKNIMYLKTVKGYNCDRFKIVKPVQKQFF